MPIAVYKDLCLDAVDPELLMRFWGEVLGLRAEQHVDGDAVLRGAESRQTVWINRVPEHHTVKNRVHLDVFGTDAASLERLGARSVEAFPRWTVMADPEGNEFCLFPRDPRPDYRMNGVVIDCIDPFAQATWWAGVFGATVGSGEEDGARWWWVEEIDGLPFVSLDFVPVPEPKSRKNRVHWDVTGDVAALLAAGATLLREPTATDDWHVLADPEGNEFCAFHP